MPLLRTKAIREMSSQKRLERLRELRTEFVRLRTMIKAGGTVENPAMIRELRKTIARILTIEGEEKMRVHIEKEKGDKKK